MGPKKHTKVLICIPRGNCKNRHRNDSMHFLFHFLMEQFMFEPHKEFKEQNN